MAAPVFGDAGTGSATTSGDITPAYPTGITANMLLLMDVWIAESVAQTAPTITGWTQVDGGVLNNHWAYAKKADGTETGTVTVTRPASTTERFAAVIYRFSADWPQDTATWANNFEDWTGSINAPSTTVNAPQVDTTGPDRLAVALVALFDNNPSVSFTGETGGDWTEAVAEFTSTVGADLTMQIQTAAMASAGTITGGSFTQAGADAYSILGFAILPTADARVPYRSPMPQLLAH